jgi:hypothetical protein
MSSAVIRCGSTCASCRFSFLVVAPLFVGLMRWVSNPPEAVAAGRSLARWATGAMRRRWALYATFALVAVTVAVGSIKLGTPYFFVVVVVLPVAMFFAALMRDNDRDGE